MATQVQFRRGNTAETAAFTGAVGEVTVDTTKRTVVIHDGSTAGGFPLMRENGSNSALSPGSLGSTALKFANSSNTGIYSPATGSVALVASGIAALTSDTSGNLTAPGLFTASGRITGTAFVPTGSTVPANGLYLSAANTVSIATNSGARLTIGPTGNVTITGGLTIGSSFSATSFVPTGSSIPTNGMYLSAPNEVSIATNGVQRFTISSTGAVTITGAFNFTGSYIADAFIPTSATIPVNGMYLPSANTLGFATNTTQRLTIDSSGNVTVVTGNITTSSGTNTAQSFIPTSSTIPVNGLYLPSANTVALATNSAQRLTVDSTGNVTANTGSLTVSSGSTTAQSFIPTSATVPANGMYLSSANTLAFATGSAQRLTINSVGNISIAGTGTLTVPGATTSASFIPTSSVVPTNGLYLSAANTLAFATNSGAKMTLNATGDLVVSSGAIVASSGSNTANSFIPTSSSVPVNGLYLPSANSIGFATNNIGRVTIGSSGGLSVVSGDFSVSSGTATANSFIPTNSTIPTNGLYLPSANSVSLATNGTGRLTIDSSGNITANTGSVIARTFSVQGSTSGTISIIAPAVAGTSTLTLPTGTGTAGQALTTDGSGVTSWATVGGITIGTAQTTTSGSTINFTGFPATVKRVTVMLNGVSTFLGSGIVRLRVFDNGVPVTSGYVGSNDNLVFTSSFTDNITDGAATRYWHLTLTQFSSTLWHCGGSMTRGDIANSTAVAGAVTLPIGILTGIRVDVASGTFDAGSINVVYES